MPPVVTRLEALADLLSGVIRNLVVENHKSWRGMGRGKGDEAGVTNSPHPAGALSPWGTRSSQRGALLH